MAAMTESSPQPAVWHHLCSKLSLQLVESLWGVQPTPSITPWVEEAKLYRNTTHRNQESPSRASEDSSLSTSQTLPYYPGEGKTGGHTGERPVGAPMSFPTPKEVAHMILFSPHPGFPPLTLVMFTSVELALSRHKTSLCNP